MFQMSREGERLTIILDGELDHAAAERLRSEISEKLKDLTIRSLVFDMGGVTFMDSSGIGMLIGRYKLMKRRDGVVCVRGANARVDALLEMAGIYRIAKRLA